MEFRKRSSEAWRRVRTACADLIKRRNPAEYFIALTLIGMIVFAVRALAGGTEAFLGLFFMRSRDMLYDFVNPLRDAAQGLAAYTERYVMYPPLGNLLLRLLGRLLPAAYLNTADEDFGTWNDYNAVMLVYLLFALLSFAWIAARLAREEHPASRRPLLLFCLLCGFPFVFWLERGNTVLFIVPLLLIFAQNYDSEKAWARELGLVALALAFALKLYPALFGVILLADRRWKEAIRCAVYGLLLLILPSFAYGGPLVLLRVMYNVRRFSYRSSGHAEGFFGAFGIPVSAVVPLLIPAFLLLIAFLIAFAFICRKRHLTLAVAAAVMLCVPSVFSCYNMMLTAMPLVLFLRQEKLRSPRDFLWFFGLALPFAAFLDYPASDILNIVCIVLVYAAAVWELIETLVKNKKARAGKEAANETAREPS